MSEEQQPAAQPPTPEPDSKDWTWTLHRPCPECGFDPRDVQPIAIPALVRDASSRWPAVLARVDASDRPEPTVWSPLEYACHIRDVLRLFGERAELIRREDGPTFANWDQDETALAERYWEQQPAVVAEQIRAATGPAAAAFEGVAPEEWERRGTRSNGSQFTLATLGTYVLHDLYHHVWDVRER